MPTSYTVYDDNGDLFIDTFDHNGNTSTQNFGKATYLSNVWRVLEDGSIVLELTYEYMGLTRKLPMPRGDLKKSELLKYAEQGLNVTESNAKFLIDFITVQENARTKPPDVIHEGVGMAVYEDEAGNKKDIFKGYRVLGAKLKSEYTGKLPIKPKGTLKSYKAFAEKHINNSPLSLAVAFGLSAIVVGFLGDVLHCESLIIHLSGESTTGKSTATRVAVSMASLPSFFAEHSLMNTFDGTENALLATLLGNMGFPACFDEADANDKTDKSQFIYRLASGRGKRRLNKDGKQKDIQIYRTTILTNGEKRLTANSNQNTGKEIRVLSFDNIPWTASAAHAEAVNRFVQEECYGVPIVHLARYMLKLGKQEVLERYESNRKLFAERSRVNDNFTERVAGKYAFILTAAELANECMELGLPLDAILDTLIDNEADTQDNRDIGQKAYDFLMEQFNVNIDKFTFSDTAEDEVPGHRDVWGTSILQRQPATYASGKCISIVCFAKEKFHELLKKGGFQEPSVIIKKFKQREWLDHEGDRNTRRRKITKSGTSIDVYALRVFESEDDDLGMAQNAIALKRRTPVNRSKK